jgi:hypothetical protein
MVRRAYKKQDKFLDSNHPDITLGKIYIGLGQKSTAHEIAEKAKIIMNEIDFNISQD